MSESTAVAEQDVTREIVSFEEAIAQSGLTEAQATVIIDPYTTLNQDKDVLIDTPFFIRKVVFSEDKTTHKPYAVVWLVTNANQLFRMTDGSTGIYKQLVAICAEAGRGAGFLIANGLRKSEYGVNKKGEAVELGAPDMDSKAATYYLA
jgi:hypothetical protein